MNVIGVKTSAGEFIINPGPNTPLDNACKLFVLGSENQLRLLNTDCSVCKLRSDSRGREHVAGPILRPTQTKQDFMQRLIAASTALFALFVLPFQAAAATVDDAINSVMGPVTEVITSVIFWSVEIGGFTRSVRFDLVVCGGPVFYFYFRFINIRGFGHRLMW